MTTDCNAVLGVETGACCYTVTNTDGPKVVPPPTSTQGKVVAEIDPYWPILKGTTRYLCATADGLSKVQGFTAGTDTTPATIDAARKFYDGTSKTATRVQLAGSVASWTCSGASALAISGAAATAFISLM